MIAIMNMRKTKPTRPYDVRVDRSSVLGNPFRTSNESERDWACDEYNAWLLDRLMEPDNEVIREVQRLAELYGKYGKLRLFCWCAPKRCHSESIRYVILQNAIRSSLFIAEE